MENAYLGKLQVLISCTIEHKSNLDTGHLLLKQHLLSPFMKFSDDPQFLNIINNSHFALLHLIETKI